MGRLIILIALTASGVSALGGCGSSKSGSAATVKMEADDFYFEPADVEATVGKATTLTIENEGKVEHNFSITELGVTKDIEAGKKANLAFTPKQSGTLQFFCKYHVAQGMKGSLGVS